jgi:hypothetical protein
VLGCLFGYLLGQVIGRVRADFGFALLEGLALNYSSRSALYATLIVSAVVMLSSLYPAWKASRLSVPELERSVQLPEPVEDTLHLEFPFTFSGQARLGISAFLYRYFKEQEELATGDFHSQDVRLWEEAGEYCQEALVWVAPYDWGISQHVRIVTSEHEGNPVLLCAVRRVNGEVKSWLRVNRRFVANLRRQLLLWRTIGPVDRDRYVAQGHRLVADNTDMTGDEGLGVAGQPV